MNHSSGLNNANDQSGKADRDMGVREFWGRAGGRKQAIIRRKKGSVWILQVKSTYESSK